MDMTDPNEQIAQVVGSTMKTLFDALISATRANPELGEVNVGFDRAELVFRIAHETSAGGVVKGIIEATAEADPERERVTYTITLGDPTILAELAEPRRPFDHEPIDFVD